MIIANAGSERQCDGPATGWRTPPCFLDVWQRKELLVECFVCVAGKGVTDGKKWDFGAFLGCVAGNGLSSFWLVFTINGTESEFSQWLICSKTGKSKEFNAECAEYAEKQPSSDPLNGREN